MPGCVSLKRLRKELRKLFLFLNLASELEFKYPSSSIDLPLTALHGENPLTVTLSLTVRRLGRDLRDALPVGERVEVEIR